MHCGPPNPTINLGGLMTHPAYPAAVQRPFPSFELFSLQVNQKKRRSRIGLIAIAWAVLYSIGVGHFGASRSPNFYIRTESKPC